MDAAESKPGLSWWQTAAKILGGERIGKSREVRVGLALGGGFARGIAHIGVLRAFEKNHIPIHAVAGVSSGAIAAAAMASGTTAEEIRGVALSMKFRDVASWKVNLLGLAGNDRMISFLARLLKSNRFEDMKIPLAIIATDLAKADSVTFHGKGDVIEPIRASCAYPGLFLPIRYQGRILVDGFVSMEVPAAPLLQMGANRIISVAIPNQEGSADYGNMFSVISRCFQIMSARTEHSWRRYSNLVISPPVAGMSWDSFASADRLIKLGEEAAMAAMPAIKSWLSLPLEPVEAGAKVKPALMRNAIRTT